MLARNKTRKKDGNLRYSSSLEERDEQIEVERKTEIPRGKRARPIKIYPSRKSISFTVILLARQIVRRYCIPQGSSDCE